MYIRCSVQIAFIIVIIIISPSIHVRKQYSNEGKTPV